MNNFKFDCSLDLFFCQTSLNNEQDFLVIFFIIHIFIITKHFTINASESDEYYNPDVVQ